MKFRLSYSGVLLGATQSNSRAAHKHDLRRVFHTQLRELWRERPYLNTRLQTIAQMREHGRPDLRKEFSDRFSIADYKFVPLVTDEDHALVSISVLFLRPGPLGVLIKSGDLDNRISTIFDALTMPRDKSVFGKRYSPPSDNETPFYVLRQDDKLVQRVDVETDIMLEPVPGKSSIDTNDARLVVTVDVKSLLPMHTRFVG